MACPESQQLLVRVFPSLAALRQLAHEVRQRLFGELALGLLLHLFDVVPGIGSFANFAIVSSV